MPNIKDKYQLDSGQLIHRIEIQRKTMLNVNGIVTTEWNTYYKCRCAINNNTGKEYIKDGIELYGLKSKKFIFRTHPNQEVEQSDIIIYKNDKWEIVSVYDYDDLKQFTCAIGKKAE